MATQAAPPRTAETKQQETRETADRVERTDEHEAHELPRAAHPSEHPAQGSGDAVELALATALERASAAGQWTVVEVLARELEARRKARSAVVDLAEERAKRGR